MEKAHERNWPPGLQTLEIRQLNRIHYDRMVCRKVPGKQAVVVLACENRELPSYLMEEPGIMIIFAHGVEWLLEPGITIIFGLGVGRLVSYAFSPSFVSSFRGCSSNLSRSDRWKANFRKKPETTMKLCVLWLAAFYSEALYEMICLPTRERVIFVKAEIWLCLGVCFQMLWFCSLVVFGFNLPWANGIKWLCCLVVHFRAGIEL